MRQVSILPAGCQITKRVSALYFSPERIIFASSLSIYVLDAQTFRIQHILSINQKAITSISVSEIDHDLMVVTGKDGSVSLWHIEDEELLSQIVLAGSVVAQWNPLLNNQVAILSEEAPRLHMWDTDRANSLQEILSYYNNSLKPTAFRWNPKVSGLIAIGCASGPTILFETRDKAHKFIQCPDPKGSAVVDLQWDRLSTSYLLVAYQFFVTLWDAEGETLIHSFDRQPLAITAIAWMDWTAGNFVSSNGKNSFLKVWNASQKSPLDSMRVKSDGGLLSLAFCPGKRSVLYSCTNGSVGVFNLKSMQMEYLSAAGHTETIFGCKLSPSSPNLFCTSSYDTTVKIWTTPNFKLQKTLYGADDIVYYVDWSPNAQMIVGGCANGLVIIWDVSSGRELARYLNHTKACYVIAWNPLDDCYVISASADCSMNVLNIDVPALYDTSKQTLPIGSRRKGPDSHKKELTLSNVKFRFVHPAPVFGAAWSPFKANIFSSACQDGLVRVFNLYAKSPLVAVLSGHNARSFSSIWSPLDPALLATSSDDQTIGIWTLDIEALADNAITSTATLSLSKKLIGHTGFVRALCWNYEHEDLLLSGSWDFTMRVWNVRTAQCLHVLRDHVADVYSITSHKLRPFTYLSASRDTTVRLWELEGVITSMRYRAVWDNSFKQLLTLAADDGEGKSKKGRIPTRGNALFEGLSPCLMGQESKLLDQDLQGEPVKDQGPRSGLLRGTASRDPIDTALQYYSIFSYFSGSNGCLDMWENALLSLNSSRSSSDYVDLSSKIRSSAMRTVFHESEVLGNQKSDARKLESSKLATKLTDLSSKGEEQLLAAAQIYAKLGDFAKYCALMVDLGRWESALAMAPSVSMDYWKYLSYLYAQKLAAGASENCVPYYLSIGKDAHAIDYYLQHRDVDSALVVAKMSEQRSDVIPDYSNDITRPEEAELLQQEGKSNGLESPRPPLLQMLSTGHIELQWSEPSSPALKSKKSVRKVRERTEHELDQSRGIMNEVSACAARQFLAIGQPLLAAAEYMAVNDVHSAVDILVDSMEYDLAYALSVCFGLDVVSILVLWSDRCAALNDIHLALDILSAHPYFEIESGLLISKYCDEQAAKDVAKSRGIKPPAWWYDHAKEEEAIGSDADAIMSNIIALEHSKACQIGLAALKKCLRDPWNLSPLNFKIFHALKYADSRRLEEPLKVSYFCYMLWLGGHEAASKGLFSCAADMLSVLQKEVNTVSFMVPESDIAYQLLLFKLLAGRADALVLLSQMINKDGHNNTTVADSLKALQVMLVEKGSWRQWQGVVRPQTTTLHDAQATALATKVIKEIQRLGEALDLPSLGGLNERKNKLTDVAYLLSLLQTQGSVLLGSLLPVANQQLKQHASLLSGGRIQGRSVQIGEDAYLSQNEVADWKKVLPFSPLLNGSLLCI